MDLPIFTIWLTNKHDWDAMPYIYELCIASWHIANPDREIIIYSDSELHLSFLDRTITKIIKIQEAFPGLLEKAEKITQSITHKSDIIRYGILEQTNGIYLDTDVLLHSSLNHILFDMERMGYNVLFPAEDDNMICNCFIIKNGDAGSKIFKDILQNYENNYIKHSYLFNSQKYLWLMDRRYPQNMCIYGGNTLFKPRWLSPAEDFDKIKEDIHAMGGIGFHLTGTNPNYIELRKYLDRNCYNVTPENDIQCLMTNIINGYMKLMKEADK